MKLTLEHLAPYLPYGLKVHHEAWNEMFEMDCIGDAPNNFHINDVQEYCKPLLRPLSDYKDINSQAISDLNCDLSDQMDLCDLANKHTNLEGIRYQLASICFENHIDIFGLIEKGLAININEI